MKVAILTANLGDFDIPHDPSPQFFPKGIEKVKFHRFTYDDFPPIAGLSPRFQYRIPKLFGWEMYPGFDIYIWLDGVFSIQKDDSLKWFKQQLGDADAAFFKHPQRRTIFEEVDYIDRKLKQGNDYIVSRYDNGLHQEQMAEIRKDRLFNDNHLYTSTAFIYRNTVQVQDMMRRWWYMQSRYFTCDQVSLPYAIFKSKIKVNTIEENQYRIPYLTEVSKHK